MTKYRVRQCAALFVLEKREAVEMYFHIVREMYSWGEATMVAKDYHCEIV